MSGFGGGEAGILALVAFVKIAIPAVVVYFMFRFLWLIDQRLKAVQSRLDAMEQRLAGRS